MRFFSDSTKKTRVNWYTVPDDRPLIPWPHMFGSRVYEREEDDQEDLGEVFSPTPWRGCFDPCPAATAGLCGSEKDWQEGVSIASPKPATWPGTSIGKCCTDDLVGSCGGLAIGRTGFGACHMESTCDIYSPFGAAAPSASNVPVQFVQDLLNGRGTSPCNTVAWTHYIDVAVGVTILDGCTRTQTLNTIDYLDGDEVRIPTGGPDRYVVVWVTLCDTEGTIVKRAYLMRHAV